MAINKRKVLETARKYAQKGAQAKALKEFDKLLKLDPRDARLRLEIGDAHRRWGNDADAIETYTRVAEQYTKEGFDARAVAVYKQIHNLKPDAYESYAPLAELYQRMGLDSEAILALQTAADGYHKQGMKAEALELLRKMATLDPTNTTSRIKVADLLRQEGLFTEAVAEYIEAGAELERQGDLEAATSVYERILEVEPERRDTLLKIAEKLVERGLADRAEPFVKRVLEAEPDEPARYELMATVYRLQHRDDELVEVYRTLADLYRRRGDDDQAREILQRYVPSAEFEEEEVGLDDQTAFGAMDSAVALGETREPASGISNEGPSGFGSLSESHPLDAPIFDPDASSARLEDDMLETDIEADADDGDFLSLDGDAGPVELELDDPLDAPTVHAAVAGPDFDADPEQLYAEASVYLRYGKREQAIANLEAIIAKDSGHRMALEKLGEARSEAGDETQAIATWLLAAEAARAEGDFEAVAVLRDRIAAIDPEAANSLGPAIAEEPSGERIHGSAEGEATVVAFDAVDSDASASDLDVDAESGSDREIELDDIEIDIDDSEFAEEIPSPTDDEGDEDDEGTVEETEAPSTEVDAGETSNSDSQTVDSDALSAGASASTVQQIAEDLEEADFYMKQGLADEAEVIYKRVLSIAPNHPHALVRLGEVAALRGDDPATPRSGLTGPGESDPGVEAADATADEPETSFREDIPGPDEGEDSLAFADADASEEESPEASPSFAEDEAPPEAASSEDSLSFTGADASPDESLDASLDASIDSSLEESLDASLDASIDSSMEESLDESLDVSIGETAEEPSVAFDAESTADSDDTPLEPDLEDELAKQFLAEVTEPIGMEVPSESVSEDADSSPNLEVAELDAAPDAPLDDDSTASKSIGDDSAAAAIASPDDSYTEAGVDLGDVPEITAPETSDAEPEADDDEASFDLAAELSDVFDDADGNSGSGLGDSGDGFEAVFSEFKKGVSRTLSEGDHEAHFDLGIAYREMGLYDDAKSEFRAAMLNSEREIQCRHMLGLCCLEQESYREAVAEFEQIAGAADTTDEQQISAQFELGRAFEGLGEKESARTAYEAVAAIDPTFCGVESRIEALAAPPPPDDRASGLESFDDLISDVESGESEAAAETAGEFETFDDLMAEEEEEEDPAPGRSDPIAAEPDPADAEIDSVAVESEPEEDPVPVAESEPEAEPVATLDAEPVAEAEPPDAEPALPEPPRPRKRKKISFV